MIKLDKLYTYEEIARIVFDLHQSYQDITRYNLIGESHDGREIPMIIVGKGEQYLICTGGVHGRESINPVVMLKIIEDYCQGYRDEAIYKGDLSVHDLLSRYAICFIPLLNPDGYVIAMEGVEKIKNPAYRHEIKMQRISPETWKYNARSVDINRNFPSQSYMRQQSSESAASENETKALIHIFQSYPSIAYIDFHSRGRVIFYHRAAMSLAYNKRSRKLAKNMQKYCGYDLGEKEDEFLNKTSGGNTVNYYSENFDKAAITVETVEDEAVFPMNKDYQSLTYAEIVCLPLASISFLDQQSD